MTALQWPKIRLSGARKAQPGEVCTGSPERKCKPFCGIAWPHRVGTTQSWLKASFNQSLYQGKMGTMILPLYCVKLWVIKCFSWLHDAGIGFPACNWQSSGSVSSVGQILTGTSLSLCFVTPLPQCFSRRSCRCSITSAWAACPRTWRNSSPGSPSRPVGSGRAVSQRLATRYRCGVGGGSGEGVLCRIGVGLAGTGASVLPPGLLAAWPACSLTSLFPGWLS